MTSVMFSEFGSAPPNFYMIDEANPTPRKYVHLSLVFPHILISLRRDVHWSEKSGTLILDFRPATLLVTEEVQRLADLRRNTLWETHLVGSASRKWGHRVNRERRGRKNWRRRNRGSRGNHLRRSKARCNASHKISSSFDISHAISF
jgi:hypothetical protein